MISVVAVAAIYMTMNISRFIGVIAWQEVGDTVATTFVERLYGLRHASLITIFVALTAFASIFAMFLGYSRNSLCRGATTGRSFRSSTICTRSRNFRIDRCWSSARWTMLASLWTLEDVINAILACRILVQFLRQNAGLMHYRRTHPDRPMPFPYVALSAALLDRLRRLVVHLWLEADRTTEQSLVQARGTARHPGHGHPGLGFFCYGAHRPGNGHSRGAKRSDRRFREPHTFSTGGPAFFSCRAGSR